MRCAAPCSEGSPRATRSTALEQLVSGERELPQDLFVLLAQRLAVRIGELRRRELLFDVDELIGDLGDRLLRATLRVAQLGSDSGLAEVLVGLDRRIGNRLRRFGVGCRVMDLDEVAVCLRLDRQTGVDSRGIELDGRGWEWLARARAAGRRLSDHLGLGIERDDRAVGAHDDGLLVGASQCRPVAAEEDELLADTDEVVSARNGDHRLIGTEDDGPHARFQSELSRAEGQLQRAVGGAAQPFECGARPLRGRGRTRLGERRDVDDGARRRPHERCGVGTQDDQSAVIAEDRRVGGADDERTAVDVLHRRAVAREHGAVAVDPRSVVACEDDLGVGLHEEGGRGTPQLRRAVETDRDDLRLLAHRGFADETAPPGLAHLVVCEVGGGLLQRLQVERGNLVVDVAVGRRCGGDGAATGVRSYGRRLDQEHRRGLVARPACAGGEHAEEQSDERRDRHHPATFESRAGDGRRHHRRRAVSHADGARGRVPTGVAGSTRWLPSQTARLDVAARHSSRSDGAILPWGAAGESRVKR